MADVFPLKGVVKSYDWGGTDLIPRLCGMEKEAGMPYAEYWMGMHASGSSSVLVEGEWRSLEDRGTSLSYLLKLLDVKKMLSIQVHPDKAGAEEGFDRENKAGIPLAAAERNYKDRNHKPELMVALTDFWLLHGFKPPEQMVEVLTNISVLNTFLPLFNEQGYKGLYHHIMRLDPNQVKSILAPLRELLLMDPPANKNEEDFWAARAFLNSGDHFDPGIFSIYLFNLVKLNKGEGIYQGAGLPHAYLEGQNVEIMANSDNVLRGGLTSKHIDVTELLRHVRCEATYPQVQYPDLSEYAYRSGVPDFSLKALSVSPGEKRNINLEENSIMLLTEGDLRAGACPLGPGSPAAFADRAGELSLESDKGALLFIASGL